ncbi:hypothetical protein MMC21_001626 [Puttea exsequens]|nr:hypothetical protein [Puttea exsequens]
MPEKTSHPLVERYRELCYNHAHAFLVFMLPELEKATPRFIARFKNDVLSLLLKVLTHRIQDGEIALLHVALDLSSEVPPHPYEWLRPLRSNEKSRLLGILTEMQLFLKDESTTASPKTEDAVDAAGHVSLALIDIAGASHNEGILLTSLMRENTESVVEHTNKIAVDLEDAITAVTSPFTIKITGESE